MKWNLRKRSPVLCRDNYNSRSFDNPPRHPTLKRLPELGATGPSAGRTATPLCAKLNGPAVISISLKYMPCSRFTKYAIQYAYSAARIPAILQPNVRYKGPMKPGGTLPRAEAFQRNAAPSICFPHVLPSTEAARRERLSDPGTEDRFACQNRFRSQTRTAHTRQSQILTRGGIPARRQPNLGNLYGCRYPGYAVSTGRRQVPQGGQGIALPRFRQKPSFVQA